MTPRSRRALVVATCLLAVTSLTPLAWVHADDGADPTAVTTSTERLALDLDAALREGAELYHDNCSVCHGPTGGGLAEARLAFPPTDRNCSRCHKANNPVVMPLTNPIVDNQMFPIGDPPALRPVTEGEAGAPLPMPATAAPSALFHYVRATMPRYHPGRQTDEEYWLITAHLLQLNGRSEEAAVAASEALEGGQAD